jgi:hypothetical protein
MQADLRHQRHGKQLGVGQDELGFVHDHDKTGNLSEGRDNKPDSPAAVFA